MYDSRSSHPRNGTHHIRAWRKEDYYMLPVRPTLTKQQAIREQITDLLRLDQPLSAAPGLKRLGWWRQEVEAKRGADKLCGGCSLVLQAQNEEDEAWERAWWEDEEAFEDETWEGATTWLPLVTIAEACQAMTDGFHITGPAAPKPWTPEHEPHRKEHYCRVYEIARATNLTSKPLTSKEVIRELRLAGEYVATHLSLVARPVAERFLAEHLAPNLVAALTSTAPARITPRRPSNPRLSERNPFLARSL